MLKKAGIIAAVAAAGIVALTPMAFANGKHDDGGTKLDIVSVEDETVQENNLSRSPQTAGSCNNVNSLENSGGNGLIGVPIGAQINPQLNVLSDCESEDASVENENDNDEDTEIDN